MGAALAARRRSAASRRGDGLVDQRAARARRGRGPPGADRRGRIGGVADRQRRAASITPARKRSWTCATHSARSTIRRTARVGERRPRRAADRARHVGVGQHEHRVLAVEREHRALEPPRARLADLAPRARGAGEADLRHGRGDERGARVGVAVDELQQSLGQPGAGEDARDPLAAQGHVRRGLEHHAVAGHQRHGGVAQRRGEGLGRRTEDADDPERLVAPAPALDRVLRAREGDPLAGQDRGPVLGQPLQRLDRGEQLHDLDLGARAALLGDDEVGELVESSMTACAARAM